MKIGIIGSGQMGSTLGKLWAAAGHEVLFSSRNPQTITHLIAETQGKAKVGTVPEAVSFGEVLFLAINYWTLDEALETMGPLEDKVLIDSTNPYGYADAGGLKREIPDDISGGEIIQQRLPDAKVTKAFSSMSGAILKQRHHIEPLMVIPFTTDHPAIEPLITTLIGDAGYAPFYLGALQNSIPIELFGRYSNKVMTLEEAKAEFINIF